MMSLEHSSKIVGIALLATAVVVITGAVLVFATDFVLLIFLGLLLGVLLTKSSKFLGKLIPIAYGWNLAIVTTTLLMVSIGSLFLFGAKIEDRLSRTSQQLDESAKQLEDWIDQYPIVASAFSKLPFSEKMEKALDSSDSKKLKNAASKSDTETSTSNGDDDSEKNDADTSQKNDSEKQKKEQKADDNADATVSSKVVSAAAGRVFGFLGRLLTTTFGLAANVGVVFFIGVFVAVDPALYRDGFAQIFPPAKRQRVSEVMNLMGETMFKWLIGRFLTMLITGAGTTIAMWILGVPMPIMIGVATGLLTFIPNIGAIIALGLAMLMALSQGPMTVVWVVLLYGVLQLLESNIATPLIQQHQTSIPPALLLSFQIIMAALAGLLGVMVATPLLAAGMVLTKEIWIKDTLESNRQTD